MNKLMSYHWPGNVRELQHCMERAVILSESIELMPQDFFFAQTGAGDEEFIFDSYNLEVVEKTVIGKALKKYRGNVTQAADELGLTRGSLYRRMEKYGI
jgi:transcriptional regulator of acetoin/glycerol metabolism